MHENLQTTMVYLDISTEDMSEALATLEEEKDRKVIPKWKNADGGDAPPVRLAFSQFSPGYL